MYTIFVQDGLLAAGYSDLISRLHSQIPKVTPDGKRLQMIVCSATLHSFDVKKMAVSNIVVVCFLITLQFIYAKFPVTL